MTGLIAALLAVQPIAPPVPYPDAVAAALADARSLPPGLAARTRYLDARNFPAAYRPEAYAVLSYHVNALSRESKLVPPRKVSAWLWAVVLDDYRWDAKVWDDLRKGNSYYAIKVQDVTPVVVKKTRQVLKYDQYNRPYYVNEEYTEAVPNNKGKEDFIPAPWLSPAEMTLLIGLTQTLTPIVRADQFVYQTGIQVGRAGHGYYDWFAFKSRADAEKLARLDRKGAEESYRELAAIVPVSGVALNNRQLFRFATLTGSWWESRDVVVSADNKNAVSHLLDDYKHDAEEIVFVLPNGLPAYYLSDAAGKQIDSVPDTIAADHRSTNNDRRIHVGYSCVACHTDGGLRPIRDYARKLYNPETGVALGTIALDPAKARRLESVYLGPLERAYKRDTADFAEAIEAVTGLKSAALAKAYEVFWSRYADDPVTLDRAAAECGVTADVLKDKLRAYAKGKGVIDPVLVGYLIDDPPPVRREYFEERFPVLMLILQGANP